MDHVEIAHVIEGKFVFLRAEDQSLGVFGASFQPVAVNGFGVFNDLGAITGCSGYGIRNGAPGQFVLEIEGVVDEISVIVQVQNQTIGGQLACDVTLCFIGMEALNILPGGGIGFSDHALLGGGLILGVAAALYVLDPMDDLHRGVNFILHVPEDQDVLLLVGREDQLLLIGVCGVMLQTSL